MTKLLRLSTLLVCVLLIAGVGYGQTIVGSKHDFSNENWNNTGEICIVCHTPHNADASVQDAPLWNHQLTTATYTLYNSGTFDATAGQPGGSSKLCLSCHDGTVAVDNFGSRTNGNDFVSGDKLIGTDLSNDHPVSFVYDASLATTDGGLFDPVTANSGLGGTIDQDLLISSKVQCASCHDVHNGSGLGKLLRISNSGSGLCLTCHNK